MGRGATTGLAWLLAALWGTLILGLGGDGFSLQATSSWLAPFATWLARLFGGLDPAVLLIAARKLAHAVEYGVFALLVGRAAALAFQVRMRFVGLAALTAVAVVAIADELRQSVSALRTGSAHDVALDLLGGLGALLTLFAVRRWIGRPMFDPASGTVSGTVETAERQA